MRSMLLREPTLGDLSSDGFLLCSDRINSGIKMKDSIDFVKKNMIAVAIKVKVDGSAPKKSIGRPKRAHSKMLIVERKKL